MLLLVNNNYVTRNIYAILIFPCEIYIQSISSHADFQLEFCLLKSDFAFVDWLSGKSSCIIQQEKIVNY